MKYLLLLILLFSGLYSSSVKFIEQMKYETNFEIALKKAKNEDKVLMMIATTQSCPWCRKMERQTLSKDEINTIIQNDFIPLSVDQDLKNFPSKYEVKVVPTVYFINGKDGNIINKTLGYKNKKDLKKILVDVKRK